jgi:HAD superfamily hydrolase (TIGR01484 family)
MKKIKLVLTDVDGTLVPVLKNEPSKAVKEVLKLVQEKGIEVTAATGRPYEMTKDLFQHVGIKDLCIFDGGATIRRVETGEIVWKNWLTVNRIKEIVKILLPVCTLIDFSPDNVEIDPQQVMLDDVLEDAPYVWAYVKEEAGDETMKKLEALKDLEIHVHYSHDEWRGLLNIQITDKESNKFHAVEAMRQITHSEIDETLAIGDSANDIPLFKSAGLKIAMGNAIDELKELADYVVSDAENDGFVEAMERFVLD